MDRAVKAEWKPTRRVNEVENVLKFLISDISVGKTEFNSACLVPSMSNSVNA
jgi:hypothetical protein